MQRTSCYLVLWMTVDNSSSWQGSGLSIVQIYRCNTFWELLCMSDLDQGVMLMEQGMMVKWITNMRELDWKG
ncbi:predicted protein [Lichtheimia corymbifera JMRC:FSU:9682]|uniref:Uncharacterized protein n=1 Tax=Lichtheimia corymbifera JMRC:FSU:9682 TaxID=1263082 RepID=A0A068SG43_9FUNG|nr:predicted protein [Lichtheimia corymbifera JMRC:FSU:9682]